MYMLKIVLLLYHADLLLPDHLRSFVQLHIDVFELVTVDCKTSFPWLKWEDSFKLVIRYILIH